MRRVLQVVLASSVVLACAATAFGHLVRPATTSGAVAGPAVAGRALAGRALAGCRVFPADNYWNADISKLPVHARSAAWLRHMSTGRNLHPDFGPSYGDGPNYGIPITVVGASHARVAVRFDYPSESDRVRYPLGADTRIEGGRDSTGDRHAIIVNKDSCRLFETYATRLKNGRWRAGSGATWALGRNALRPEDWTSADAAGLPILPGLLRWSEVRSGHVTHAIRFTTDRTARAHLWPARHDAGSGGIAKLPPMGARFRLRASYDASKLGARARVVVRAMKTYGLVLADNGSPWFFQGERNGNWPDKLVSDLKLIPSSAFVAVDTRSLRVDKNSAQVRTP
jgi:hypothetical protein